MGAFIQKIKDYYYGFMHKILIVTVLFGYPRNIKKFRFKAGTEDTLANQPTVEKVPNTWAINCLVQSLSNCRIDKHFDETIRSETQQFVGNLVEYVKSDIAERNPLFNGKLVGSGSFFDGTKIEFPNEFDYTWYLNIQTSDIELVHQKRPQPTDPKTADSNVYPRTYFLLKHGDGSPLKPLPLVKELQRQLTISLSKRLQVHENELKVELHGPAVSFYLILEGRGNEFKNHQMFSDTRRFEMLNKPIKVDIAVSIDLSSQNEFSYSKRFKCLNDLCPRQCIVATELGQTIRTFSLVTAGHFWRLSFAEEELNIMKSLTEDQKTVYMALKSLRDISAPSEQHESSPLPTYYLKSVFLKMIQEKPDPEEWAYFCYAKRSIEVLDRLSMEARNNKLSGIFIENNLIGRLSQEHYHMEANRMKKLLFQILKSQLKGNFFINVFCYGLFTMCLIILCGLQLREMYWRELRHEPSDKKSCSLMHLFCFYYVMVSAFAKCNSNIIYATTVTTSKFHRSAIDRLTRLVRFCKSYMVALLKDLTLFYMLKLIVSGSIEISIIAGSQEADVCLDSGWILVIFIDAVTAALCYIHCALYSMAPIGVDVSTNILFEGPGIATVVNLVVSKWLRKYKGIYQEIEFIEFKF